MIYTSDGKYNIDEKMYVVQPGNYNHPRRLVENVNVLFQHLSEEMKADLAFKSIDPPRLIFDEFQNRVFERVGEAKFMDKIIQVRGCVESELADLLGLSDQTQIKYGDVNMSIPLKLLKQCKSIKERYNIDASVDINAGRHAIYIYSDIVQHSIVGDSHSRILRVLQVSKKDFGDSINISFPQVFYHTLSKFDIESIEIDLKDGTGEPIKFQYGNVIAILHFRRKNGN